MNITPTEVLKKLKELNTKQVFKNNPQVGLDSLALIFNVPTAELHTLIEKLASEKLVEITETKGGNRFITLTEKGKSAFA